MTEEQDGSRFKLPAAIKPVWDLLVHLTIGATVFGGVPLLALLFAGLIRLIGLVPFAPWWLVTAAERV